MAFMKSIKGDLLLDASKTTQNYVSYIYSKEVILKSLLEKGIIGDDAFSRYDQILYDRYHINASLGVPRPIVKEIPKMDAPTTRFQNNTYLSLTALAREKDTGHFPKGICFLRLLYGFFHISFIPCHAYLHIKATDYAVRNGASLCFVPL